MPLEGPGICAWLALCAMRIELEWRNLVTSHPYPSLSVHLSISLEPFKASIFNLIYLYNLKCEQQIINTFNEYVPGTVLEADDNG